MQTRIGHVRETAHFCLAAGGGGNAERVFLRSKNTGGAVDAVAPKHLVFGRFGCRTGQKAARIFFIFIVDDKIILCF